MAVRLPIYLDYAATTPLDPRVLEAMMPALTTDFGNAASRTHPFGWRAEARVKEARESLAEALGGRPEEVVFTSGATESNALAVLGGARAAREKGDHVVTSAIEHKAVLETAGALEREGFRVTYVRPGPDGVTGAGAVREALEPGTVLVSVMAANNEIGTLNPVEEIGALCKERGVLFHTDAAQAFGKVPLDVMAVGADLVSVSAHKLYGPKGVGALWVRSKGPRVRLLPLTFGGGHERGLRPGTLNVPGIVGFGAAARIATAEREAEAARVAALRDRLHAGIAARLPSVRRNGHPERCLPGTLNLSFEGVDGEGLLMALRDLAVSSGSACTSASPEPSHVLRGIGVPDRLARASVRFSLGRYTTAEEVDVSSETVGRSVGALLGGLPARVAGPGDGAGPGR
ncbi:MAG: aminotransferase class V-fold PLP-dependent enzyme [Acidobacteria bacterium]|nr:MAG: aminotransferase class V-fold PLP-dependent enzyme [Acidobacteriota bacterium]